MGVCLPSRRGDGLVFGSDVSLLTKYGRGEFNSNRQPSPVGLLKPNDFGLFDMLGNAAEWCLDDYAAGPIATNSAAGMNGEGMSPVLENTPRVVRGGSYTDEPQDLRCGSRASMLPAMPAVTVGFRVARSYPERRFATCDDGLVAAYLSPRDRTSNPAGLSGGFFGFSLRSNAGRARGICVRGRSPPRSEKPNKPRGKPAGLEGGLARLV